MNRDLNKAWEGAIWRSEGRVPGSGTASAKVLGRSISVQGTGRRPLWLEQSELGQSGGEMVQDAWDWRFKTVIICN